MKHGFAWVRQMVDGFLHFFFFTFLTQIKPLTNHIHHKNHINQSSDRYSIYIKKYYIAF